MQLEFLGEWSMLTDSAGTDTNTLRDGLADDLLEWQTLSDSDGRPAPVRSAERGAGRRGLQGAPVTGARRRAGGIGTGEERAGSGGWADGFGGACGNDAVVAGPGGGTRRPGSEPDSTVTRRPRSSSESESGAGIRGRACGGGKGRAKAIDAPIPPNIVHLIDDIFWNMGFKTPIRLCLLYALYSLYQEYPLY